MEGISKFVELRMTESDKVKGKQILGTSFALDQPKISKEIKEWRCYPEEKEFYSGLVKEKKKVSYELFVDSLGIGHASTTDYSFGLLFRLSNHDLCFMITVT